MCKKAISLICLGVVYVALISVTIYPMENFDENTYHYWTAYNNGILPTAILGGVTGVHGYYAPTHNYSMGDYIPDPSSGLWNWMQGDEAGDQGDTTPWFVTDMTPLTIDVPPDYTTQFTYPYALTNPDNPYYYYELAQTVFSQGYWGLFWQSPHTSWYLGDVNGGYLISDGPVDLTYAAHLQFSVLKLPGGGGSGYLWIDYATSNDPAGPWTNLIDGHQIQHSSKTWVSYIEDLPSVTLPDGSHNVYLLLRFRGNVTTAWANAPFYPKPNYWIDDLYIYNDEPPLPVELSAFTVTTSVSNHALLTWVTQSETNVSGFNIYRGSSDVLADAEQLNAFIAATNTSQPQTYVYLDEEIWQSGTYYYWLESRDLDGTNQFYGPVSIILHADGQQTPPIELRTGIENAYPNPFNQTVSVSYNLSKDCEAQILVYNHKGQAIRHLASQTQPAGNHRLNWDARDDAGRHCASGVYYVVLRAGNRNYTHKVLLIK